MPTLSDSFAQRVKIPKKTDKPNQVHHMDRMEPGLSLVLAVSYGGTRTWHCIVYVNGQPRRHKLGTFPQMRAKEAREKARAFWQNPRVASEQAKIGTFQEVADQWVERVVKARGNAYLRGSERERILSKYIFKRYVVTRKTGDVIIDWRDTPFLEIDRGAVNDLLDIIEDNHTAMVADSCLSVISAIAKWYQTRVGSYTSPIVPGMRRDKRPPKERNRSRVLDDTEIKLVWAASENTAFNGICRLALLTGSRREKLATMKWSDIREGIIRVEVAPDQFVERKATLWHIASNNPREKGTAEVLPLSALALKVINEQPKVVGNEYVFAAPRGRPFCNWSNCKTEMDSELPADMPRWTVHDLRRTARTRLSKCKVPTEVSERILGHSLKGMAQIYNRDEMLEQMAIAMDKLSARIQSIVDPENNVLPLRAA